MASIAFPSLCKKAKLSDGTTYGYAAVAPALAGKPTFLLLHGYPSSCWDWRHQISALSRAGFGIVAPDLLGYGDTDSPDDVAAYNMKRMSLHISEILDQEGVEKCIAVGHDWGVSLVSRLITWIPSRLLGVVFVSVGYLEPGVVWDVEKINKFTEEELGTATLGYWAWHDTEEAVADCNENPASIFGLIYPADPAMGKTYMMPVGAAAKYVRAGRLAPLPSWYNLQEYTIRDRIFSMKGYRGPLNWYKACIRGVNMPDEEHIPENERSFGHPTLLVVNDEDSASVHTKITAKWAQKLRVEALSCGHWVQLERREELNKLLEGFAAELVAEES